MRKFKSTIIFIILPILTGLYFLGSFYYRDRFPRRVYVNEVNIGGMTLEKADNKLSKAILWDKLTIKSNTEDFLEIHAEEIDYKYMATPELPKIFNEENNQNWFLSLFKDSVYTTPILYDYNKDRIKSMIDTIGAFDRELLDAQIIYLDSSNTFIIQPHSYEIKISKEELFDMVVEAIDKRNTSVNIEANIEQPSIFDDNKALITTKDKANEYLDLQIKYDFEDRVEIVDGSVIKDFIAFEGTDLNIDPEKVKEYVAEIGRKYDTFGRSRRFKTSTGKIINTNGGSYGWLIHRGETADALIEHIKTGESKTIEPVYSYRALIRSTDDIGNSYVEIDLEDQMVYVYIQGQLKIKTPTVTGNLSKGQGTPTGVYPINYKETDAILTGEDYASPVKYWMPFNKDIGLHDADWREEFGEEIYKEDGSNGCVNLPPEDARTIFDLVYPGMPVIVH